MQDFTTPMMRQYQEIKKQYKDCLLFYRMGDFYELFMEDAAVGAQVLNITLTSRPKGKDGRIPMAGVPYHAVDAYLTKLVRAGFKVAICEQVSLPNKKGIIDREVVRIITPGTVLDEKALDKKQNNYIISLLITGDSLALTAADISTGFFSTIELPYTDLSQVLRDELSSLSPSECILPEILYNDPEILKLLKAQKGLSIYPFHDWDIYANNAEKILKKQFAVTTLVSFGIQDKMLALAASSALLGYLQETQKAAVTHIKKLSLLRSESCVVMDKATMLNLELFSTIREHDTKGSLLTILDQTMTAMGGRLLKQWICKPLTNKDEITERHEAVSLYLEKRQLRTSLREQLKVVNDIERLVSRLSVGLGNARDLINLSSSLLTVVEIKKAVTPLSSKLLQDVRHGISPDIQTITTIVQKYICPEPPISLREGGLITEGVNKELDLLRTRVHGSKDWIMELERKEKERTGISSLKIRFNKVFGFYIEISKSNIHLAPSDYMRKQTLINGERFITPELKEHEEIILTAEERINELEFQIFTDVLSQVLSYTPALQDAATSIAVLDCLLGFAHLSEKERYVRPVLLYSGEMRITAGRHPVVEKLLPTEEQFVPNDVTLDNISQSLLLITGPNMAGKSVFIRQIALIVLLSQIGCFVPADKAHLSIVDRIFVRSGASDVITSGLSTFMVEMVETAHILHHATKDSLIIMDEIGRGTSTYDGISIAWAVAEYLATTFTPPPKTLFATHYHELQVLEEQYPTKINNFHMSVANDKGEPIFLHTIMPGGASHSFGVAVAKLAGIPEPVISKAKEILHNLESRSVQPRAFHEDANTSDERIQLAKFTRSRDITDHLIQKELEHIDIHQLTPLEALNKLAELKDKLKLLQSEHNKYLESD